MKSFNTGTKFNVILSQMHWNGFRNDLKSSLLILFFLAAIAGFLFGCEQLGLSVLRILNIY